MKTTTRLVFAVICATVIACDAGCASHRAEEFPQHFITDEAWLSPALRKLSPDEVDELVRVTVEAVQTKKGQPVGPVTRIEESTPGTYQLYFGRPEGILSGQGQYLEVKRTKTGFIALAWGYWISQAQPVGRGVQRLLSWRAPRTRVS